MATTRRSSRLGNKPEVKPPSTAMPPPPPPPVERKRKASPNAKSQDSVTPIKRRAKASDGPPPLTPTPSRIKLIAEPVEQVKGPLNKAATRLAESNSTNATLLSPETSRLVASSEADSTSPSKPPKTKTTTANLLEEACAHLIKVDARMRPLIEKHHCRIFSPEGLAEEIDPFESLASSIISQQVSGAAAKSIKAKFVGLFELNDERRFPRPSEVAACSIEHLRTAGLSQRKAEYIKGLSEKFANGELSAQMLHDASYEEVFERLIAVRGLGKWSVEMFACFALKIPDVFSTGDLGVARGMAALLGRDVNKLKNKGGKWKYMAEKEMEEMAGRFSPYRSIFMWYMWRVEETDISTLE
ncbi:DNA-3-methyladenine glycosylase-like protein [Paramyrothecium foliicola]|nr:DNA-3-methyladenine glycosylase-like protein [Paramyrothecium foliicola]